jgi:hypothetical protein
LDFCGLVPISALGHQGLKVFLETAFKRHIPSISTLSTSYTSQAYSIKLKALQDVVRGFDNFYIEFDDADYRGNKYYAFLIGNLDGEKVHPPHLIELTQDNRSPTGVIVQQKVIKALSTVGLVAEYEKFRLFLKDGVSFNLLAGRNMKTMYPKMLHVTCVSHMLHRVAEKILESSPRVLEVTKYIGKVFKNSSSRNLAWQSFKDKNLPKYEIPVRTRWGSWLRSARFISKHWTDMIDYLCSVSHKDCPSAKKALDMIQHNQSMHRLAKLIREYSGYG